MGFIHLHDSIFNNLKISTRRKGKNCSLLELLSFYFCVKFLNFCGFSAFPYALPIRSKAPLIKYVDILHVSLYIWFVLSKINKKISENYYIEQNYFILSNIKNYFNLINCSRCHDEYYHNEFMECYHNDFCIFTSRTSQN